MAMRFEVAIVLSSAEFNTCRGLDNGGRMLCRNACPTMAGTCVSVGAITASAPAATIVTTGATSVAVKTATEVFTATTLSVTASVTAQTATEVFTAIALRVRGKVADSAPIDAICPAATIAGAGSVAATVPIGSRHSDPSSQRVPSSQWNSLPADMDHAPPIVIAADVTDTCCPVEIDTLPSVTSPPPPVTVAVISITKTLALVWIRAHVAVPVASAELSDVMAEKVSTPAADTPHGYDRGNTASAVVAASPVAGCVPL